MAGEANEWFRVEISSGRVGDATPAVSVAFSGECVTAVEDTMKTLADLIAKAVSSFSDTRQEYFVPLRVAAELVGASRMAAEYPHGVLRIPEIVTLGQAAQKFVEADDAQIELDESAAGGG